MSTHLMVPSEHSLVVVEPDDRARAVLEHRLQAQGYRVVATASATEAAAEALAEPPSAVVAPLRMPGFSGVQLCHLLKAEAATTHVPVILVSDADAHHGRYWAERSGASWVRGGAMGELLRTVERAIIEAPRGDGFFTMLGGVDVRDRIAAELDRRLFDSILAADVRALSGCESFERLFDQLSQLVCRLGPYGWLALADEADGRLGVHAHPDDLDSAAAAARQALGADGAELLTVVDGDARRVAEDDVVTVLPVPFGSAVLGRLAISASARERDQRSMLGLISQELGLPLRIASLVETTRLLARQDPLTGVLNRRAFIERLSQGNLARRALALCIVDLDHFKAVNDHHGHAAGDLVLQAVGRVLRERAAACGGAACRWGGEEFLLAVPGPLRAGGRQAAEGLRVAIEALRIPVGPDVVVEPTASIGLAVGQVGEALDLVVARADAALYQAKAAGRNRVQAA